MLQDLPLLKKSLPTWVIFCFETALIVISWVISCFVLGKVAGTYDKGILQLYPLPLCLLLFAVIIFFARFRTFRHIIRYNRVQDFVKIALLIATAHLFTCLATWMLNYKEPDKILIYIILLSLILSSSAVVFARMLIRFFYDLLMEPESGGLSNIIIIGATDVGLRIKHIIDTDYSSSLRVVGFIEEDTGNKGKKIEGIGIFSTRDNLRNLIVKMGIDEVIFATHDLSPGIKAGLLNQLLEFDIRVKEVPPLSEWINSGFSFSQLEAINIEDLLNRDPVHIENDLLKSLCTGNTLMVTGAAGSIGSEIVRKLCRYRAKRIICIDQAETPVAELRAEIRLKFPATDSVFLIINIRDRNRLRNVLDKYPVDIIFHAAALKHVPLMEENIDEVVLTNIFGTINLVNLAVEKEVQKFVMISTDKAVNPTSVMGATKRIAEMYVQHIYEKYKTTQFIITRFGNVLGSNGSVIPVFKKQIQAGGPVTVTHPDIKRFFMTIPEACQLVLEAATMGNGSEIFVFEMGEPVRIADLAYKMIRLAGKIPGKDIRITYTGLRPGEKLYEELLGDGEVLQLTYHPKIRIATNNYRDYRHIEQQLELLRRNIYTDSLNLKQLVFECVSGDVEEPALNDA